MGRYSKATGPPPSLGRRSTTESKSSHSQWSRRLKKGRLYHWVARDAAFIIVASCRAAMVKDGAPESGTRLTCPHGKQKFFCRKCRGKGICEHGRQRSICVPCGGGSICQHGIRRTRCIQCGGGSICIHRRLRHHCTICQANKVAANASDRWVQVGILGELHLESKRRVNASEEMKQETDTGEWPGDSDPLSPSLSPLGGGSDGASPTTTVSEPQVLAVNAAASPSPVPTRWEWPAPQPPTAHFSSAYALPHLPFVTTTSYVSTEQGTSHHGATPHAPASVGEVATPTSLPDTNGHRFIFHHPSSLSYSMANPPPLLGAQGAMPLPNPLFVQPAYAAVGRVIAAPAADAAANQYGANQALQIPVRPSGPPGDLVPVIAVPVAHSIMPPPPTSEGAPTFAFPPARASQQPPSHPPSPPNSPSAPAAKWATFKRPLEWASPKSAPQSIDALTKASRAWSQAPPRLAGVCIVSLCSVLAAVCLGTGWGAHVLRDAARHAAAASLKGHCPAGWTPIATSGTEFRCFQVSQDFAASA